MATAPKPKPKAPAKPAPKEVPNKLESLIQDVTNRYRVTAKEARDIVTAVGTLGASAARDVTKSKKDFFTTPAVKNLKTQVAEAGKAAVTGKSGTTSEVLKKTKSGAALYNGKPRP
jgi:hypothetical protein